MGVELGLKNAALGMIIRKRKQFGETGRFKPGNSDSVELSFAGVDIAAEDAVALLLRHFRGVQAMHDEVMHSGEGDLTDLCSYDARERFKHTRLDRTAVLLTRNHVTTPSVGNAPAGSTTELLQTGALWGLKWRLKCVGSEAEMGGVRAKSRVQAETRTEKGAFIERIWLQKCITSDKIDACEEMTYYLLGLIREGKSKYEFMMKGAAQLIDELPNGKTYERWSVGLRLRGGAKKTEDETERLRALSWDQK
ncbi:hypothetical protein Tco_0158616, partial [Tanacetum coccineum]